MPIRTPHSAWHRAMPIALTVVWGASCNPSQVAGPKSPAPAGTFELILRVGQHHFLPSEKLDVSFEKMTGDSRCPTRVVCVWEGAAGVQVKLRNAWGDRRSVGLALSGSQTDSAEALGYRVTAVRLDPYPDNPRPIPLRDYLLTLSVTPIGR